MGITVNGVEITDRAIEAELPHHQRAQNPLKQSVNELVLRTVLLQEADRLDIAGEDDDTRIETLFTQEVRVPVANEEACRNFYRNRPEMFSSGEIVEARHILFQVTSTVSLEFLRTTAESILAELQEHPERFAELAKMYSNCPSGTVGGNLGQLTRGQTVPEFEGFVFRLAEGEMGSRLLETRFGLHIVQVMRRVEGKLAPYEAVREEIAENLTLAAWQRGVHQYMQILVGRAKIEGITLEGAESPLVQ